MYISLLDEKYIGYWIKIQNNSSGRPLWVIGIRIGVIYLSCSEKTLRSFKKYVHSKLLIFDTLPLTLFNAVHFRCIYPLPLLPSTYVRVTPPSLKQSSRMHMNFWMKTSENERWKVLSFINSKYTITINDIKWYNIHAGLGSKQKNV